MVRVSFPAKLRPWSELTAQNGDGGGSCVGEYYCVRKGCGKLAEILRKVRLNLRTKSAYYCVRKGCGKLAEILREVRGNLHKKKRFIASGKGAEILRKVAEMFLQWPLPERPRK